MDEGTKNVLKDVARWMKYVMIPPALVWVAYGELLFEYIENHYYIIFIMLGAMFNAMMDTVSHHFTTSVFKNKKSSFWNPEYSWMNKYKKMGSNGVDMDKRRMLFWKIPMPSQLSDFWHMAKTLMIVSISIGVATFTPYVFWIDLLFIGYFWNITFSLFYDTLLRRK